MQEAKDFLDEKNQSARRRRGPRMGQMMETRPLIGIYGGRRSAIASSQPIQLLGRRFSAAIPTPDSSGYASRISGIAR